MDTSPFANLAGELRNRIYELVLHEPEGFKFLYKISPRNKNVLKGICKTNGVAKEKQFLAITKVCRQIRKEALRLFYNLTSFTQPMHFWRFGSRMSRPQMQRYGLHLKHARKWLNAIGFENSDAISRFELYLGG